MSLLKPATNSTAFAKIGMLGFAGSGKTFTATELAIGLAHLSKGTTVAFFDTEKGSDFMKKKVEDSNLTLMVHKGRAFSDLISVIKEVEKEKIPVLIIDSITHVWRDLVDSYQKQKNKKYLTMADWGILKGQWKTYTDLYINSSIHILMLGRAGFEYETHENEDTGRKEMIKGATKMKVEGETGFEPDLLIEMYRMEVEDKIVNRAWVMKDRTNTLNGKHFDCPTFKTFQPFWNFLNISGTHQGYDASRDSSDLFKKDSDYSYENKKRRKDIALESIQEALVLAGCDGTSSEAKKKRTDTLIQIFGTSTKTGIENMDVDTLETGVSNLRFALGIDATKPPPPLDMSGEIT